MTATAEVSRFDPERARNESSPVRRGVGLRVHLLEINPRSHSVPGVHQFLRWRRKRFHRWLIAALLFHAALLTGLISTGPRQLGDASGMDDAISVSLVTESELRGNATVADRAAGEPMPPPQLRQAVPEPQETPPPEPAR